MTEGPANITLRPADESDRGFLLVVYAHTRAAELQLVDWTDDQKAAFVRQQFEAQNTHYRSQYDDASFLVVEVDGEPAGRLYLARIDAEVRVMDIALLPSFQRRGIGERVLRGVLNDAAREGLRVGIHVERFNPARRLYARLGFVEVGEPGPVYLKMEWTPPVGGTSQLNTAS